MRSRPTLVANKKMLSGKAECAFVSWTKRRFIFLSSTAHERWRFNMTFWVTSHAAVLMSWIELCFAAQMRAPYFFYGVWAWSAVYEKNERISRSRRMEHTRAENPTEGQIIWFQWSEAKRPNVHMFWEKENHLGTKIRKRNNLSIIQINHRPRQWTTPRAPRQSGARQRSLTAFLF